MRAIRATMVLAMMAGCASADREDPRLRKGFETNLHIAVLAARGDLDSEPGLLIVRTAESDGCAKALAQLIGTKAPSIVKVSCTDRIGERWRLAVRSGVLSEAR